MKRPPFVEGVFLALILAVAGGSAWSLAMLALPPGPAAVLLVNGLATAYALYLLFRSPLRAGRVTVGTAWLALIAGLAWAPPSLLVPACAFAAALWLLRSVCYHRSLAAVAADLALHALAAGAAVWTVDQSGSVFLAVWSYFLTQALFTVIPRPAAAEPASVDAEAAFERARRNAEAALRRLVSHP